jgi:hypothetical protein
MTMPKPRRNRTRKPSRRKPFREPLPLILIVCEGERTEPDYFNGLAQIIRNPRVKIEIAKVHGVPLTLVRAAKKLKDSNPQFDSVWCLPDVDEHPFIPEAVQMARDNGIRLAISNPCFELWLLLHFRESPGMKHRDKIAEMLTEFIPGYDKAIDFAKSKLADGYDAAVQRAKRIRASMKLTGDEMRNPSTDVYRLTELMHSRSED